MPGCILNAGRIEYAQGDFHFYTEGFTDCVARLTEAIDAERIALLDAMGYESDIAAHGIGGAVETDSIKEAIRRRSPTSPRSPARRTSRTAITPRTSRSASRRGPSSPASSACPRP